MPVTIDDISRQLGLSSSTVSKALNDYSDVSESTKQRVRDAAVEVGYTPSAAARSLARQKTNKIGLVFNSGISYASDYFSEVVVGATITADRNHHNIVLYINEWHSEERLLNLFRAREVDGLILVLDHVSVAMVEKLIHHDLPFVVLGRRVNHPSTPYIAPDNYNGALALMKHLFGLGHRRIGFTANPLLKLTNEDRLSAYKDALENANIAYDPALVVQARIDHQYNELAMHQLLDLPDPPTAIFAFHDLIATEVLQTILKRGLRVPQDIALAGFDGLDASLRTSPPITTVKQPLREIGSQAVGALINRIENSQKPPTQLILPVELAIRESTEMRTIAEESPPVSTVL